MTALSPEERAHFEALLNEYEKMREDAQDGLKTVVGELREKLTPLVAKGDLADEIAGFRLYVRRRFLAEYHPEKVAKADAKSEIADAYEFQASQDQVYTTRTRSAGRASQTPHDADTGEVIEQPQAKSFVAAWTEVIEQNPEPGAGDEGMENGSRANPARTMLEPNSGSPSCAILGGGAIPVNREEADNAAEGGSPSPITEIADELEASISLPNNSHGASETVPEASSVAPAPSNPGEPHDRVKASEAIPSTIDKSPVRTAASAAPGKIAEPIDPANPRVRAVAEMPSLPDFLRRANTDQVGRA